MNKKYRKLTLEENKYVLEKLYQFTLFSKFFVLHENHADHFNDLSGSIEDLNNNKYVNLLSISNIARNYKENIFFKAKENQSLHDVIMDNYHGYLVDLFEFDENQLRTFITNNIDIKDLLKHRIITHNNSEYPEILITSINVFSERHFDSQGFFLHFEDSKKDFFECFSDDFYQMKIPNVEQILVLEELQNSNGQYSEGVCSLHVKNLFYTNDVHSISNTVLHEFVHYMDAYFFQHYCKVNNIDQHGDIKLLSESNNLLSIPDPEAQDLISSLNLLNQHLSSYSPVEYEKDLINYFDILNKEYPNVFTVEKISKIFNLRNKYHTFKNLTNEDEIIFFKNLYSNDDFSYSKKLETIEKKFHTKFNKLIPLEQIYNGTKMDEINDIRGQIISFLKYDFTKKTTVPSSSMFSTFSRLEDILRSSPYFTFNSERLAFLYTDFKNSSLGIAQGKELVHFHKMIFKSFNKILEKIPSPKINDILSPFLLQSELTVKIQPKISN